MARLAWFLLAVAAKANRLQLREPSDPTEAELQSLYGGCPTNNAVCVVIRMRNPRPSDDCSDKCDEVATRLTTSLQPGQDPSMPKGCGRCVAVDTTSANREVTKHWAYDVIFPYDEVTDKSVSNEDVYTTVVEPSVDQAFGCQKPGGSCKSAAFFAYGASGSGKSFTMGFEPGKKDGIMQLGTERMFDSLKTLKAQNHPMGNQKVFMTFYEIYGGDKAGPKVFDLLATKRGAGLKGTRREIVPQLNFAQIDSLESMMAQFAKANKNRQTSGTGMNEVSSRSHAIVELLITDDDLGARSNKISRGDKRERAGMFTAINKAVKVMYVDLAGSENAGKWEDQKLKDEGSAINQALGSLRLCIASAANPNLPPCSWRNSPLTVMLHDLFDMDKRTKKAKAFTRMIATINPSADPLQVMHTKSTMQYASQVKSIKIAAPEGKQAAPSKVLPEQIIANLKAALAAANAREKELENELAKKPAVEIKEVPIEVPGGGADEEELQNCYTHVEDLKTQVRTKVSELDKANLKLELKTTELAAQQDSCESSMQKAMDDLSAQEEETGLCNKLLGEVDASARIANKKVDELLQQEVKYLEKIQELENRIAELETRREDEESASAARSSEQRQRACKLLEVSSDVLNKWQKKSNLEITLGELSDIDAKQKSRKDLLDQLRQQKRDAGKVKFTAWLGQMVADLSGQGETLGPIQKRLMELDQAIDFVQDAYEQDDQIRNSLLEVSGHIIQTQTDYLALSADTIAKEGGDAASAKMLFTAVKDMQGWLSETQINMQNTTYDASAYVTEMDAQAQRSICFSRLLLVKNAAGTCPDAQAGLEEYCQETDESAQD
eukprot:gb/GFBE01000694.1/.p1 GENE.gb/GFBE01000694.1/~~gb/GFBE01000694.1/.p1  ORF type:complete len:838 (+),score=246.68 gb/GFBE01000694.1/:1-2514(+)